MRSRLLLLLAALALLPSPAFAQPSVDAARRLDSITVEGRGAGHGHGMSQWGAEGQARQGRTYRQILAFYYPGTRWGRASGSVRVLISDAAGLVVRAERGLAVRGQHEKRARRLDRAVPRATAWRVQQSGSRSVISYKRGSWHRWRSVAGWAQFTGADPVALHTHSGWVRYRGTLRLTSRGNVVNAVPLDVYVSGVVPQEVPALWHTQAVRAQAVAARTYAAFERRQPLAADYDLCDTEACQVYGGASAEHSASNAAVRATAHRVLTSGGTPAFTQFSASNGGWTAAGDFSYLPAKEDPYDRVSDNPYLSWTTTIPGADIEAAWPVIGTLSDVEVTERDGNGAWGGRVVWLRITGDGGTVDVSGPTFRSWMGLRETFFHLV